MGEVLRTELAKQDLVDIWGFIAEDNRVAADRFIDRLEEVFSSLSETPMMGRSRSIDLLVPHIRSFPVGNYVVFYYPDERGGVVIVRVFNAARDIENLLDQR